MDNHSAVDFVTAMCETGEARRYQQHPEVAATQFASDLADQAREMMTESRDVLHRAKGLLRVFCAGPLAAQLSETYGGEYVFAVDIGFSGIYQWTVNIHTADTERRSSDGRLQIKFGPTAWFANEIDKDWSDTVDPADADYSMLFLTHSKHGRIVQSSVGLSEVLDGLDPSDKRLHDELISLVDRRL